jgi:hypothetical protein
MKKVMFILAIAFSFVACQNGTSTEATTNADSTAVVTDTTKVCCDSTSVDTTAASIETSTK